MFAGLFAMPSFKEREFQDLRLYSSLCLTTRLLLHRHGRIQSLRRFRRQKGWLTAILELGAWVGALLSSFMAEYFSRKYGIIIATVVFIIGVIVQTTVITSAGPHSTLGGRFVTGMGVGSLSMIVPIVSLFLTTPSASGPAALRRATILFHALRVSFRR